MLALMSSIFYEIVIVSVPQEDSLGLPSGPFPAPALTPEKASYSFFSHQFILGA